MPKRPNNPAAAAELRRCAEVRLDGQQRVAKSDALREGRTLRAGSSPLKARPEAATQRLLHELEVHQIELEMQNAELQKARDELEVALENYTDLYDFAPVGYFSIDESGLILEANLMGAALLGVERSRLINLPLLLFVSPMSRPIFPAFLKKVFTGPKDHACEMLLVKEGGLRPGLQRGSSAERAAAGPESAPFWAGFRATPAVTLKGTRRWCRLAVTDITSRKQAEEVLRRNEALFSALIEQAPVGVYVVDGQLRLLQVNPKARPVFSNVHPLNGRDLGEIMHILWPEKLAAEVVERFRHTLKTGQPYYSPEFSERRRDTGEIEFYEWQLQRITLPAGQRAVVCFFDNITERKQAEETQRRLAVLTASNQKLEREIIRRQAVEKTLQESERHQSLLSEQARRLSHQILHAQEEERKRISRELHDEIAQTLVGINIHLAALTREAAGSPTGLPEKIAQTQRLVEKSVDVVHRFARELRPTALDDLGLIPALLAFMKEFTHLSGVRAHLTAFAAIEQLDIAKRTVLYRVAHEALNNVARHAQATRVEVSIEKLRDHVCLKIQDDGKSFDVERALHSKGNGRLGLLGMRERLEMVGGNFAVESAPGKGTTIQAQIPLGKARVRGPKNPVVKAAKVGRTGSD